MIRLVNFLDVPYEIQFATREWRNDRSVSKFFKINYIDEEIHKKWLQSMTLQYPKTVAFLIQKSNNYIGVTYFSKINYVEKNAEWGIYIFHETARGHGVGDLSLSFCINYALKTLHLSKLFLDVLLTNYTAISLYNKHGFKELSRDDMYARYIKELTNS